MVKPLTSSDAVVMGICMSVSFLIPIVAIPVAPSLLSAGLVCAVIEVASLAVVEQFVSPFNPINGPAAKHNFSYPTLSAAYAVAGVALLLILPLFDRPHGLGYVLAYILIQLIGMAACRAYTFAHRVVLGQRSSRG